MKTTTIGEFGVDSGLLMICDPSYLKAFSDNVSGYGTVEAPTTVGTTFPAGVLTLSPGGDGIFTVTSTKNDLGQVVEINITKQKIKGI